MSIVPPPQQPFVVYGSSLVSLPPPTSSPAIMYSMHHGTPYAYPAPAPVRHFSAGTSSAFSPSANPDEDWTKISDLAMRRRIQNRIAQRNYRKKLKKRLEDLEKQAADNTSPRDGEASQAKNGGRRPTQGGRVQKPMSGPAPPHQKQQKEAAPATQQTVRLPSPTGYTSPTQHDEYQFGVVYERDRTSRSPPTSYHHPQQYSVYPPPPAEEMMMPYAGVQTSQQPYRPVTTEAQYQDYLPAATTTTAPVSVTLPSLSHFSDALIKRESSAGGYPAPSEQTSSLPPYGAMQNSYAGHPTYLSAVGMGHNAPSPYSDMPHTPPLSHSFNHPTSCPEPESYTYPATPLSMPSSPSDPSLSAPRM